MTLRMHLNFRALAWCILCDLPPMVQCPCSREQTQGQLVVAPPPVFLRRVPSAYREQGCPQAMISQDWPEIKYGRTIHGKRKGLPHPVPRALQGLSGFGKRQAREGLSGSEALRVPGPRLSWGLSHVLSLSFHSFFLSFFFCGTGF
jgi:hypothetical protein